MGENVFIAIGVYIKKLSFPWLVRVVAASSLIACLVTTSITPTVLAQSTSTTVGTLTLVPTFKCISVYANFTGDGNANNDAVMQYKKSSDSTWKTGMQMVVDRWATVNCTIDGVITNPFYHQWRGSIVGLDSNTSYDVRVTFSDSNGVSGTNPLLGTISTRNETIPVGTTARYVAPAASGGSNSNDGSLAHPWLTITYGLAHISAGQTLYVRAGTYNEQNLSIPSGTSWNTLTSIINYGTDSVTISGNRLNSVFDMNGQSYFRIKGLTIKNGGTAGIDLGGGCAHFLIENCSIGDCAGAQYQALLDITDGCYDGTIRYINFFTTASLTSSREYSAIRIDDSYGGWVVHDITYTNPSNLEYINDFFGNANSQLFHGGMFCDSDVYNMDLRTVAGLSEPSSNDNGFELKTAGVNVRIFDNKIVNSGDCFISTSPIMLGPMYIFHNEMWRTFARYDCAFKEGSTGDINGVDSLSLGYVFAYNNTVLAAGSAFAIWSGGAPVARNHNYRNNIFYDMTGHAGIFSDAEWSPFVLDYNCYSTTPSIVWNDVAYGSCADLWAASGKYEQHGINTATIGFVNATNYADLHLASTSPCRNVGVIIQGFNDSTGPFPYSGSAPDIGAYEYQEGAPSPTPTPTPTLTPSPTPTATSTPTPTPTLTPSPTPTATSTPTPTPTLTPTPTPTPIPSPGYFGLNAGDNIWSTSPNAVECMRFQNTIGTGTLTRLELLSAQSEPTGNVRMGVYADNSGVPGSLLLDAGAVAVAANTWCTISNLSLSVTSGTYYWLCYNLEDLNSIRYQSGQPTNSHGTASVAYGALPSGLSGISYNSNRYVMRAYVDTGAGTPTPTPTPSPTPSPVYTPGDANGDGSVNSLDITKVKRIIMELDSSTPGADANGDGVVNAIDITRIEQIILGQ